MPKPYSAVDQSGDAYSDDGFDQEASRGLGSSANHASSTPHHASSRHSLASQHQSHDEYEDSKFDEPEPPGPSKWAQEALPDEDTIQSLKSLLQQRRLGGSGGPQAEKQQQQHTAHPRAGSHTVRRGRNSLAAINTDYAGSSVPSHHVPPDTSLESAAYQRACQVARAAREGAPPATRDAPPSPVRRPASARRSTDQAYMDRLSAPKWHPEGWGTAQAALVPQVRASRKQFPFKPTIPKASRILAARTTNGAPFLERLEQHERERLSRLATQKATIEATSGGGAKGGKGGSQWSDASWQRVRQQQDERRRKIDAQREALYGDMGRPLTRWGEGNQRAPAPPVAWDEVKDDFLARMDDAAASRHELREELAEKGRVQRSGY